ncbi:hypothetical protein H072_7132 [Dactylellina haptotyla CBS 200.50]|uniref:Extracellular membrane protein CFEM domain-containing protein n=1 Tax=Dactylellina haptotyla (strain CBS 200.50) TaxID=1284197 RepID=S8A7V7_DACHA|nr:hypothetical protein H072_7132 [Dactylellina haptotyla CBS 200.50]
MSPQSSFLAFGLLVTATLGGAIDTNLGVTTENLSQLPDVCNSVVTMATNCGVTTLNFNDQNAENRFFSCFCQNPSLNQAAQQCLQGIDRGQLVGQSTVSTLNTLDTICKQLAIQNPQNGNPTVNLGINPTPTNFNNNNNGGDVQVCNQLANSITSCGAPNIPAVTSINVANCLCQPNVNLSNMAAGCLGYLRTANPAQSSALQFFTNNYCGIYTNPNAGSFGYSTPGNYFGPQPTSYFGNYPSQTIINFGQTSVPRSGASSTRLALSSIFVGAFGLLVVVL